MGFSSDLDLVLSFHVVQNMRVSGGGRVGGAVRRAREGEPKVRKNRKPTQKNKMKPWKLRSSGNT